MLSCELEPSRGSFQERSDYFGPLPVLAQSKIRMRTSMRSVRMRMISTRIRLRMRSMRLRSMRMRMRLRMRTTG
jgi:hypothetical protein